jgi:hypothetical protein
LFHQFITSVPLAGNTNIGRGILHLAGCQHTGDVRVRAKFSDRTNGSNCRSCRRGMYLYLKLLCSGRAKI